MKEAKTIDEEIAAIAVRLAELRSAKTTALVDIFRKCLIDLKSDFRYLPDCERDFIIDDLNTFGQEIQRFLLEVQDDKVA